MSFSNSSKAAASKAEHGLDSSDSDTEADKAGAAENHEEKEEQAEVDDAASTATGTTLMDDTKKQLGACAASLTNKRF